MLFQNRGIGLFTGEVGCGKSTAIRYALDSLSATTHRVVYLYRGMDNIGAFYSQIASELGIIPKFRKTEVSKPGSLQLLLNYILNKRFRSYW